MKPGASSDELVQGEEIRHREKGCFYNRWNEFVSTLVVPAGKDNSQTLSNTNPKNLAKTKVKNCRQKMSAIYVFISWDCYKSVCVVSLSS